MPPVAAPPKTADELKVFVAACIASMTSGHEVVVTTTWHLRTDDPATAKVDVGYIAFRKSSREHLTARWKVPDVPRDDLPVYAFPDAKCAYLALDMVATAAFPDALEDEAEEDSEPPEPVAAVNAFLVETWAPWTDAGDPVTTQALHTSLRQHYTIPAAIGGSRARHFEAIVKWTAAAADMQDWNEGSMLELGKFLVVLLRDEITREEGIANVADVHKELYHKANPDDKYAIAVAKVGSKPSTKRGETQPRDREKKTARCWKCGETDHVQKFCPLREKDKDKGTDKPKTLNADAKDFRSRVNGSSRKPGGKGA